MTDTPGPGPAHEVDIAALTDEDALDLAADWLDPVPNGTVTIEEVRDAERARPGGGQELLDAARRWDFVEFFDARADG